MSERKRVREIEGEIERAIEKESADRGCLLAEENSGEGDSAGVGMRKRDLAFTLLEEPIVNVSENIPHSEVIHNFRLPLYNIQGPKDKTLFLECI